MHLFFLKLPPRLTCNGTEATAGEKGTVEIPLEIKKKAKV